LGKDPRGRQDFFTKKAYGRRALKKQCQEKNRKGHSNFNMGDWPMSQLKKVFQVADPGGSPKRGGSENKEKNGGKNAWQ